MDKLEKVELRKQAEKFVEPGFKLVMKEKVRARGASVMMPVGSGMRRYMHVNLSF